MEQGSHAKIIERLDDHQRRLDDHHRRFVDVEHRLDTLEADRQMVRDLAQTTRDLGHHVKELAEGIEAIAERAVEKVLERHSEKRRASWKYRLGYIAAISSCTGFLLDHLHVHPFG